MADRLRVIVATSAFGMGVDKRDVRAVMHWTLPGDLTEYFQATGRAGRDGEPALALLLYCPEDRRLREWQIAGDAPGAAELGATFIAAETRAAFASTADAQAIAATAGLTPAQVRGALVWLQRAGIVRRASGAGDAWSVVRSPRAGELAALAEAAAARRRERRRALDQVIAYATGGHCRRWVLLAHFGEGRPGWRARCCDLCEATGGGDEPRQGVAPLATEPSVLTAGTTSLESTPPMESTPAAEPTPSQKLDLDTRVLHAIRVREGHATIRVLAKVLAGAREASAMRGLPLRQSDIAAAVARLVEARLVVAHHGAEPVRLALTRRGRERCARTDRAV